MTADHVDLGDTRLHYRFDGPADAPVLVLSNSLGTSLAMWNAQVAALTRSHRLLRYDTRGHGASAVPPGPYTIERLGRDVLALLDALQLPRVRFCGLSLGGMTGMWLGVHAPARVERLVLCNTAAHMAPADLWNTRIAKVRSGGMAAIVDGVLERWFTADFRAQHADRVAPARRMLLETSPDGYIAACEAVRDMDQRDAIAAIDCPTLVVAGSHDLATPPADGRFVAERIRRSRYVELPAAHLSNIEAEAGFTSAVTGFLD